MLLAKSTGETLLDHTQSTVRAFIELFGTLDSSTELGLAWSRFFRVDYERFWVIGYYACLCHDIGKGNSSFQSMIESVMESVAERKEQATRHEYISAMMLCFPEVIQWLDLVTGGNAMMVVSCVIGHHCKAVREKIDKSNPSAEQRFSVPGNEVLLMLRQIEPEFPSVDWPEWWAFPGYEGYSILNAVKRLVQRMRAFKRGTTQCDLRLRSAVLIALVNADSIASATARLNVDLCQWLGEVFPPDNWITSAELDEKVIGPRTAEIEARQGHQFQPNDVQVRAMNLPRRAFLYGSCGGGKTLGGHYWLRRQAQEMNCRYVLFLYPTRASALEGFRDYMTWAPEQDASLIHSTANYELLNGLNFLESDERSQKDFSVNEGWYSLAYWGKRIISATIDQFLAFIQCKYSSMCLVPVLAQSAIVVDEVHCYDEALWSAFMCLVKNYDIPILAMTASMPQKRMDDLRENGFEISHQQSDQTIHAKRYRVSMLSGPTKALRVLRNQSGSERILWFCNTVRRCQEMAVMAQQTMPHSLVLCYHSAFKLVDRKSRHAEVMRLFCTWDRDYPIIVVCTQVGEMSLELSSTVLFSEQSPCYSALQRMGRNDRFLEVPGLGRVYFYTPDCTTSRPYQSDELKAFDKFIEHIKDRDISQQELTEAYYQFAPVIDDRPRWTGLFDDSPWTNGQGERLRDIEEFRVNAVLKSDVPEWMTLKEAGEPVDGLYVPVPFYRVWKEGNIFVADDRHYTTKFGFWDSKE